MAIYLCSVCGHVAFNSVSDVCPVCGAPKEKFDQMDQLFKESKEKSPEGAIKHVPVLAVNRDCKIVGSPCVDVYVKVGEVTHPTEEKHYIMFVDCYLDEKFITRLHFTPSVYAVGAVHIKAVGSKFKAVEHCNIHGWWENEIAL